MDGDMGWVVAPDGGRPDGRPCAHLELLTEFEVPLPDGSAVCAACEARGWSWVRLRRCVTCGHVGCCDSSRGRHAYDHHVRSGHPVVRSLAPDEEWAWCFTDEVFLVRGT
ncbi:UBP-type zinc finger domain-containing protein [Streptomyces venezuelae ATCC 10712]